MTTESEATRAIRQPPPIVSHEDHEIVARGDNGHGRVECLTCGVVLTASMRGVDRPEIAEYINRIRGGGGRP